MFVLMISKSSLNRGHFGSITRSECLKPYSSSRGQNFASIFINFYQNVSLGDISIKFEHGSCWVKTRSLGQFFKNLVHSLENTVLLQSSWNFTRKFVLIISWSSSNMGHVQLKSRSHTMSD